MWLKVSVNKTHWKMKSASLNWYFPIDAHQKSEGGQWGPIKKKTRLFHLGNVEKPPHPQFSARRAPAG